MIEPPKHRPPTRKELYDYTIEYIRQKEIEIEQGKQEKVIIFKRLECPKCHKVFSSTLDDFIDNHLMSCKGEQDKL